MRTPATHAITCAATCSPCWLRAGRVPPHIPIGSNSSGHGIDEMTQGLATTDRMLNFGDCDISGTAYYPAYLNILNGVVEEFWTHIGYPWHEIIWKERWGTPTVHLTCDFSKPSFFGDRLTFRLTVVKVGISTFMKSYYLKQTVSI